MSKVAMIKTNQSSFELIPEEDSISEEIMDHSKSGQQNHSDAANQQAAQAAFAAARILQDQQNLGNFPELTLFSQQQQLIQQRILEAQIARNRELLLQAENNSAEAKPLGVLFHQVSDVMTCNTAMEQRILSGFRICQDFKIFVPFKILLNFTSNANYAYCLKG